MCASAWCMHVYVSMFVRRGYTQYVSTVLPHCYALLAVTPPPLFSGEITV